MSNEAGRLQDGQMSLKRVIRIAKEVKVTLETVSPGFSYVEVGFKVMFLGQV